MKVVQLGLDQLHGIFEGTDGDQSRRVVRVRRQENELVGHVLLEGDDIRAASGDDVLDQQGNAALHPTLFLLLLHLLPVRQHTAEITGKAVQDVQIRYGNVTVTGLSAMGVDGPNEHNDTDHTNAEHGIRMH